MAAAFSQSGQSREGPQVAFLSGLCQRAPGIVQAAYLLPHTGQVPQRAQVTAVHRLPRQFIRFLTVPRPLPVVRQIGERSYVSSRRRFPQKPLGVFLAVLPAHVRQACEGSGVAGPGRLPRESFGRGQGHLCSHAAPLHG
ncbi:hypothetical protein GCM10010302_67660 [Streptomyces polychromogenes]|uniref:Uncharacterized protein n=1 Tax=Streptomyces polychromogenes TaxID=67342 RepID=A0ABP3FIW6_9ACTN